LAVLSEHFPRKNKVYNATKKRLSRQLFEPYKGFFWARLNHPKKQNRPDRLCLTRAELTIAFQAGRQNGALVFEPSAKQPKKKAQLSANLGLVWIHFLRLL